MSKPRTPFKVAPPRMTILSDHPIDEKIMLDDLEAASRLSSVFDILRHADTKCPLTVALYGDWGTGKTSAMRWLEDKLNKWNTFDKEARTEKGLLHPRVYPIWFDPWKYHSKEDVWRGIISEVILSLFKVGNLDRENVLPRMKQAAQKFGGFLGRSFLHALASTQVKIGIPGAEASISGETFREIYQEYNKAAHPEKAYLNQFEDTLKEWITSFLKSAKKGEPGERIALFIDDLDRCLPSVTLEVLEAIKLYLNIPQLIFVCGLDRNVVDAIVAKHYDGHGLDKIKSQHYLNKIFQVEVDITPSSPQVTGYIGTILADMDKQTGGYWSLMLGVYDTADANSAHNRIRHALQRLAQDNPREIKRLLNSALLRGRAAADNQNLYTRAADSCIKNSSVFESLRLGAGQALKRVPNMLFAQGVCTYLLQRSFAAKLGTETTSYLFRTELFLQWLKKLSYFLLNNPNFPENGKDILPEDSHDLELGESSQGKSNDYLSLIRNRPNLLTGKSLDLTSFQTDEVFSLLRIPFSVAVAQSTPSLVTRLNKAITNSLTDNLRLAIISQLGKDSADAIPTDEELQGLQVLNLNDDPITDADLEYLTACPNIVSLSLKNTQVTDIGMNCIARLNKLTKLIIANTRVGDIGISHLINLRLLTELNLDQTNITNKGLEHLTTHLHLSKLNLDRTKITDDGLSFLSKLPALYQLNLRHTEISDEGLIHIGKITELAELFLMSTQITNQGLKHLVDLPKLRKLSLYGTNVSNEGLSILAKFPELSELYLNYTRVNDEGLLEIPNIAKLSFLNLSNTEVSDRGLLHLAGLTQLAVLELRSTKVSNKGLTHLAKLTQLKRLYINDTQANQTGGQALRKSLPKLAIYY